MVTFDRQYDTSIPLANFHLLIGIGNLVVIPLLAGLGMWLVVGLALSFFPDAWRVFSSSARRTWRRDALVAIVLALVLHVALERFDAHVANWFHAHAAIPVEAFPGAFNSTWPAVGFFLTSVLMSMVYSALVGLAVVVVRAGWRLRAWWLGAGLIILLASLGPSQAHSVATYAVGWVEAFVPLLLVAALVGFFLRDNVLAYVAVFFCGQLIGPLWDLFTQPHPFYRWNGITLAIMAVIVLVWMFWGSARKDEASVEAHG